MWKVSHSRFHFWLSLYLAYGQHRASEGPLGCMPRRPPLHVGVFGQVSAESGLHGSHTHSPRLGFVHLVQGASEPHCAVPEPSPWSIHRCTRSLVSGPGHVTLSKHCRHVARPAASWCLGLGCTASIPLLGRHLLRGLSRLLHLEGSGTAISCEPRKWQ